LAYHSCHSMICQWIRNRVVAKCTGFGERVFTSMDVLLNEL
jgi:hypothetical protein